METIYCVETGESFKSLLDASKSAGITRSNKIKNVLDKPNRTAGGYHWCTNLEQSTRNILTSRTKIVICYETKIVYTSLTEASNLTGTNLQSISNCLDKPNRTAGGYHWCTNLEQFNYDIESCQGPSSIQGRPIFCYEIKVKFNSIREAGRSVGVNGTRGISECIDDPTRTYGDYHWCTNLEKFDGIELTGGREKPVYCYETKKFFESITLATSYCGLKNSTSISSVVDNTSKTAGGYHWCTSLDSYSPDDSNSSSPELEVKSFLQSLDLLVRKDRFILNGKEIDLFVEDKKFGIEFNGNYWHSERFEPSNKYHQEKTLLAISKGVYLVQIFSHQWDSNKEIFKSVIANKLGLSKKIYARKCSIVELDDCNDFLNNNHLQGNCSSSVRIGLTHNDELVSIMTFGKPRFNKSCEWELIRFCNKLNLTIVGGASKLLKYFERKYYPKSIISYANLQWSNGNLYRNLGFTQTDITSPNYWWTKNNEALSRYQCQKHKLNKLLVDNFNINLSEKENMEKSGYSRLFDCGNLVFIKKY